MGGVTAAGPRPRAARVAAGTAPARRPAWSYFYLGLVVLAGTFFVADALRRVIAEAPPPSWVLLAALTWASGMFALRVPGASVFVSVSETFVFSSVIFFGPGPAVLTVAADGLLSSLRQAGRRLDRTLFNIAEPALSVGVAAHLYAALPGVTPLAAATHRHGDLFVPVAVLATVYLVLNTGLTLLAVASDGQASTTVWRRHLSWVVMSYYGSASVALLVGLSAHELTWVGLATLVPLVLIIYLAFRVSIRQTEEANRHLTQLNRLYLATVESLAMAIDARDQTTHGHLRRVQVRALALARALGIQDEVELKALEAAALLHDMGKLAVPDYILNKPGRLTPGEYERIKLHSVVGAEILAAVDFPYPVVPIVRHHHENWDGSGYPEGLAGDAIPIGARFLSAIDCYDALTSNRPYRRALSHEEAVNIVLERRGRMYDPAVVDAFVRLAAAADVFRVEAVPPPSVLETISRSSTLAPPGPGAPPAGGERAGVADELLRLCETMEWLAGHVPLEDAAEVVARRLARLVPRGLVAFYLKDPAADELRLAHASGPGASALADLRIGMGLGLTGWVGAHVLPIANSDPALDLGDAAQAADPPLQSTLSVPLVADRTLVGVLSVYSPACDVFQSVHVDVLQLLSGPLATMLTRCRRFERERAADTLDRETGLPNDQYLERLLTSHALSASPLLESLGVVVAELHGATPETAASAVTTVRQAVRTTDLVAHRGPGQVVVLVPGCEAALVESLSERINGALRDLAVPRGIAWQMGVALAPDDGESLTELLVAAQSRAMRSAVYQTDGGDDGLAAMAV